MGSVLSTPLCDVRLIGYPKPDSEKQPDRSRFIVIISFWIAHHSLAGGLRLTFFDFRSINKWLVG